MRHDTTRTTTTASAPSRPRATEGALRRLGWTVLRPLASRLGGQERSRVLAPGAELAGLREYQAGDDVRLIDWHVTARSDRPFVREAQAERALDAWLLVDVSRSVDWGTASCLKRERGEELAALAWGLLARHGNRVGVLLFADRPLAVAPPAAGEAGLRRMLVQLDATPRQVGRGRTDLGAALTRAEVLLRRPSLIVIVSDLFVGPGWQRPLGRLARRHEIVAARLADPRDADLPDVGVVAFEDPETGDQVLVDTGDAALRARFAEAARAEAERVRHDLAHAGVEQIVVSTAEELLPALARFLALRPAPAAIYPRSAEPAAHGDTAMSFQWPQLLVALALLPLLVALYVLAQRRRRAYALRFANFALLNAVVTRSPGWRRHLPPLLYLLSLAALLVALARPTAVLAVPRDESSVVLAIDVSGSMSADDLWPSRLVAAEEAASAFVDRLPEGTRVALVTFQSHATVQVPLTADRDALHQALGRLQANGGTAIGDGLLAALDQLKQRPTDAAGRPTPAVVVLLSDGMPTAGMPPAEAAARAKQAGVKVHTVGIGQRGAAPVIGNNQTARLDEGTLRQIATATDGQYFYAGESAELRDIYADLSSQIAWVEEKTEVTALLAGVGSVLMVAAGLLGLRWFQQFP